MTHNPGEDTIMCTQCGHSCGDTYETDPEGFQQIEAQWFCDDCAEEET